MITGARQLTTACSGRAISKSLMFKGSSAPLMPSVRLLCGYKFQVQGVSST